MGSFPKIKGVMDQFFKGHGDSRYPFFVVSKGHQKIQTTVLGGSLEKDTPTSFAAVRRCDDMAFAGQGNPRKKAKDGTREK